MNSCSYCKNKKFYHLANDYIKCTRCKKKFSLKKIERDKKMIHAFCTNGSALEISKQLNLNYVTVSKKFMLFRKLITSHLDTINENSTPLTHEFDEYIYMKRGNIYSAINFLTFNKSNFIYNLMLPNLHKFTYYEEKNLKKFLQYNKIAKLQSSNSIINNFWHFFEEFLKKYKGVNQENFIYYLKEAEFKFNYNKPQQEEILYELYFNL